MVNLNGIKNIIFDLGGVLLNIDFKKTFDAFAALGIENAHKLNDRPEVLQLFIDLECGMYERGEFLEIFRKLVNLPSGPRLRGDDDGGVSDGQIIAAFNALFLDFPSERIELVKELSKKYRIFLLSNTNAIHAEYYNGKLDKEFGIKNLDHLMEKAFYSHELGCRKPGKEIYLKTLSSAGLVAEECLFIDDNRENVVAAEGLGIRAVQVTEDYTILEVFGSYVCMV